jgi:acyl-coenzyme A thioesterase 9
MRQAFELAWANTYVYTGKRPYILHMDDISFRKPVSVGSLLYFNSQVKHKEYATVFPSITQTITLSLVISGVLYSSYNFSTVDMLY